MADEKKRLPVFLLWTRTTGMGPGHERYSLILDAAVAGGWKPARALAEYARHQNIVPAQEASALADGLENVIQLLNEHPRDAGELQRFRPLADPRHAAGTVEFFRGGAFQIDDYTKEGRAKPFLRDVPL